MCVHIFNKLLLMRRNLTVTNLQTHLQQAETIWDSFFYITLREKILQYPNFEYHLLRQQKSQGGKSSLLICLCIFQHLIDIFESAIAPNAFIIINISWWAVSDTGALQFKTLDLFLASLNFTSTHSAHLFTALYFIALCIIILFFIAQVSRPKKVAVHWLHAPPQLLRAY